MEKYGTRLKTLRYVHILCFKDIKRDLAHDLEFLTWAIAHGFTGVRVAPWSSDMATDHDKKRRFRIGHQADQIA